MSEIILYYGRETCARVTMTALEQIGLTFDAKSLDLAKGEHRSSVYAAINPNQEVPALVMEGRVFTQNAAILHYLGTRYPAAGLLPKPDLAVGANEPLEHLIWCSSTLHILRRQVLNPPRFTVGDTDDVRAKGLEGWSKVLPRIEQRLSAGPWWYGDTWSIVDVYVNWSLSGLMADWLDLAQRPALLAHQNRLYKHPACIRALAREQEGQNGCTTT